MAANLRAGDLEGPKLRARYAEVASLLTGRPERQAEEAVEWVRTLGRALAIPKLGRWGLRESDAEAIAARGLTASSMKSNPVTLDEATLADLIRQAL
jgi:alcohol dehydrogenase class IV